MAQPTPYIKAANFAQDESNAVGGRSTLRTAALDAELSAAQITLSQTLANLALIQRDDGRLRDGVVQLHTLSADVAALLTASRATPRGAWATDTAYAAGDVVTTDGRTYLCAVAHTSAVFATDLAADRWMLLAADVVEPPAPADFGAAGDGVADDTSRLLEFFAYLSATGLAGDIGDDKIYKFTTLTIPTGVVIRGKSVLRHDGSATTVVPITVAGTFKAECLHVSTPGTDTIDDLVHFDGAGVDIGEFTLESDVERAGTGGSILYASDFHVGRLKSTNVARPFNARSGLAGPPLQRIFIDNVDITGFIRGLALNNCENFSIGPCFMRGRDSRASASPGHNGVLIQTCRDFSFGDLDIADAAEHAFRIGGSGSWGGDTTDFSIGVITARRSGGCGFKIAPAPDWVRRGHVEGVFGIDVGEGSVLGNKEVVRITDFDQIRVGWIKTAKELYSTSCTLALTVNSGDFLVVDNIEAFDCSARIVRVRYDQDTGVRDVSRVYVNNVVGSVAAATAAFEVDWATTRTIGDVYINGFSVFGYTSRLLSVTGTPTMTGPVSLSGVVTSSSSATLTNGPLTSDWQFNVVWQNARYTGPAGGGPGPYTHSVGGTALDFGSTPTYGGNYFATNVAGTAALGAYSGAYALSRVGSTRRGAAVAGKQTSATQRDVGIAFLVGSTATTADETLVEKMLLKHTGTLWLASLGVYADNAAALSGGLVANDVYRTTAGELRIVV